MLISVISFAWSMWRWMFIFSRISNPSFKSILSGLKVSVSTFDISGAEEGMTGLQEIVYVIVWHMSGRILIWQFLFLKLYEYCQFPISVCESEKTLQWLMWRLRDTSFTMGKANKKFKKSYFLSVF